MKKSWNLSLDLLIVPIFPSGPKVVTEREEDERLEDAMKCSIFGEKCSRFQDIITFIILLFSGINQLTARQGAKLEQQSWNVND